MRFARCILHVAKEETRMAQRISKKKRTLTNLSWVKTPEQQSKSSINDNRQVATSHLQFREQKNLDKRAEDLSWQLRFAQMKLHHWSNIDNVNWDSLDKLKKIAEGNLADLGLI